jgi:hypothetical protein
MKPVLQPNPSVICISFEFPLGGNISESAAVYEEKYSGVNLSGEE